MVLRGKMEVITRRKTWSHCHFFLQQILHILVGDRTRAFEVRRLRINTWALAKTKTGLCLNYT